MTAQEFEALLPLKVESMIEILIKERHILLQDALTYLYSSQLYSLLEREETKMWYYSPKMLISILDSEKETGILTFPE
ncbi:MAG: hypothetical protein LBK97_06595 [Prevotellaceae bacterium]|jgi:hypothetical protein|nr:hypothetical protein [Prevotellaceae bacterium]